MEEKSELIENQNNSTQSRLYYSIGEVCKITGVEAYVLRYWESEFPQLRPKKSRGGNRIYRDKDIEIIKYIKNLLYEEEYTIAGAKKKLTQKFRPQEEIIKTESEKNNLILSLKEELKEILSILKE